MPFWGPKHRKFSAPIEHGEVVHGRDRRVQDGDKAGKPQLTPAWISRNMHQAEPAVIANGVVFGYGSGEDTTQADAGHRPGLQHRGEPRREIGARHPLRARRADRRRALVERRSDHVVQPLQQPLGRQRPRLHRHVRRQALLLRRRQEGGRYAVMGRDRQMRLWIRVPAIVAQRHCVSPRCCMARGAAGGEWTTSSLDAQRTGWLTTDARLTKEAVQKHELKFLWKSRFENETRQLNSLTQPVLLDRLIGFRGFKALAFVGGSDDRVFAIDTDLGRPYWTAILNYSANTGGQPAELVVLPRRADRDAEPAHQPRAPARPRWWRRSRRPERQRGR